MKIESTLSHPEPSERINATRQRSFLKSVLLKLAEMVFPDRQFVSILKYELSLLAISIYSKLSPVEWAKTIRRRNLSDLKVNLGNGPFKHTGWINVDCSISFKKHDVVCDLRRKWPLRSGSAKYIFSEHVFEHFGYPNEIGHILSECHRILKPGGVLRVIVPNAERYLRAYANDDEDFIREVGGDLASKLSVVNVMMRENGFHKYSYDFPELQRVLKSAGFVEITQSGLRASRHQDLNLDFTEPQRDLVSLYVEAVK